MKPCLFKKQHKLVNLRVHTHKDSRKQNITLKEHVEMNAAKFHINAACLE